VRPKTYLIIAASLLGSIIFWYVLHSWTEAELKLAEQKEQHDKEIAATNEQHEKVREAEREANAQAIAASNELIEKLSKTMAARDAESAKLRSLVLAPKTAAETAKDAKDTLGFAPQVQLDNSFRLTQEQMQSLLAMKVDVDQLKQDKKDLQEQLEATHDTIARLNADVEGYKESMREKDQLIASQRETIEAYKRVAKKTKLRRTLEFTGRIGLTAATAYLAAKAAN
jgi:chromosome segregation ATPase